MAESPKRGRPTAQERQEKNEPHDKAEIIGSGDAGGATEAESRSSEFVEEVERTTSAAGSTESPYSDSSSGTEAEGHEASGPCVTFFDAASPAKALSLTGVTRVKLYFQGKAYDVELEEKSHHGHRHLDLTGVPIEYPAVVGLSLADTYEVGCARYRSATVSFLLNKTEECCCIPVPLYQLPETCNLRLRSYDCSFVDFVENAKAFLNGAEWTVTAVKAPIAAHGTTPKFQPWSYTARSEEGFAEVPELPLHQLYRIEARGPEGYLTEDSATQYRYICCEQTAELQTLFRPCCKQPARSVVFVRQECSGARWANSSVNLGGVDLDVDSAGILNLPRDLTGIRTLTSPGKVFNPPYLDLREGASPVSLVSVSDLPGADMATTVRGRFVDDANLPFVRRPITVLLPNGDEAQVTTDDAGYFEAPHGSKVFAREDEWGLATEPIIVKQS